MQRVVGLLEVSTFSDPVLGISIILTPILVYTVLPSPLSLSPLLVYYELSLSSPLLLSQKIIN